MCRTEKTSTPPHDVSVLKNFPFLVERRFGLEICCGVRKATPNESVKRATGFCLTDCIKESKLILTPDSLRKSAAGVSARYCISLLEGGFLRPLAQTSESVNFWSLCQAGVPLTPAGPAATPGEQKFLSGQVPSPGHQTGQSRP